MSSEGLSARTTLRLRPSSRPAWPGRVDSMTAVRMNGTKLAVTVREDVAREVAALGHVGLATVLVGDDPASHVYIAAKHKAATEAGIDARDVRLPVDTSEEHVLELIDQLNRDEEVDG